MNQVFLTILLVLAFGVGYYTPRPIEVESTQPIVFSYEITDEAARYLLLKSIDECKVSK